MMQTKFILSVEQTKKILAAAEQHAQQNNWNVAIAIVDDGGHLLAFSRGNQTSAMTVDIAIAKANAAAIARRETKQFEEMINQGRTAFLSVPTIQGMLEGGVPITIENQIVGAVGVSGVASQHDAEIAKAGCAALKE